MYGCAVRHAVLFAFATAALLAAGCGDKTRTVTSTVPGQTVTVTTPTATQGTTETTPSQTDGGFRKPAPGEGELTIAARLVRGAIIRTSSQPSDFSQYTYLELQPDDGGKPLRIAAAGDLSLPPGAGEAFVNPACRGKLHGTFRVTPAPARVKDYDWELLSASLPSTKCGGP